MSRHRALRVKRVRLGAPRTELVQRGAILLEDALHTASLAEADCGRLFIVRSLHVGRIRSTQSPGLLALNIEERFLSLRSTAVYVLDADAHRHTAVYFRNDAEPSILLSLKLARGERADEWFWSLAVPSWRAMMPRDDALRHLLIATTEREHGAAEIVAMLCELCDAGVLDRLLATLRPEDGATLLSACGWSSLNADAQHAEVAQQACKTEIVPARWQALLDDWVERWGADDRRTLWLAAAVLASVKPLRLYDPQLVRRARRLVDQSGKKDFRGPPRLKNSHAASIRREMLFDEEAVVVNSATDDDAHAGASLADSEPHLESFDETHASEERFVVHPKNAQRISQEIDGERATGGAVLESGVRETNAHESIKETRADAASDAPSALPTRYAGLYFLLPLMPRLGVAELLTVNRELLELDFPQRLIRHVAARMCVPADDPVMQPLATENEADKETTQREEKSARSKSITIDFVMPQGWRKEFNPSGPLMLRRVKGQSGARLLSDGSGRLSLGLWRGRAPRAARELVGNSSLKKRAAVVVLDDMQVLVDAWLLAMRRWCARYARMTLRELVCRSGRISATRTHVDIFFNHQQADVRVRRAGLDLDPGWTEWLGRVVLFHYLYGE